MKTVKIIGFILLLICGNTYAQDSRAAALASTRAQGMAVSSSDQIGEKDWPLGFVLYNPNGTEISVYAEKSEGWPGGDHDYCVTHFYAWTGALIQGAGTAANAQAAKGWKILGFVCTNGHDPLYLMPAIQ